MSLEKYLSELEAIDRVDHEKINFSEYWLKRKDRIQHWEIKSEELRHLSTWLTAMSSAYGASKKERTKLIAIIREMDAALKKIEVHWGVERVYVDRADDLADVAGEARAKVEQILGEGR